MLNNEDLSKILSVTIPPLSISDIHWRTQDSEKNSVLFYKIKDGVASEIEFSARLEKAKFAWLIVNKVVTDLPANALVVEESKWPKIQKDILDILYPIPKMKLIGITGTNGKTTTADLVLQLGTLSGKKGLSIGTLGVREYNKTLLDFGLTSPSYIDLRKYLNLYGKDKDFCVVEASSHALVQERLFEILFDAAGWTSFSQDHLDYHQTMDEYFKAKSIIFSKTKINKAVFIPSEQKALFNELVKISDKASLAPEINSELPLFFKTQFNKNNLEVAVAIIENIFDEILSIDYNELIPPDGRFYIQNYKSNYIVVDFAHTPDALENICLGIKKTFPNHKLKVLFGCGGDRDRLKRPKMAEVVARFADEVYVTSDNPRSEDPEQIIKDIIVGLAGKSFTTIVERPLAVQTAFSELKSNEVLLLAGKGHEDYILINGVKHPYSDIKQVDEFIRRNKE
jgi:UDP-N-acetylmuramoyl-L-alanyl-D-glutamate--2,6-diaminopimelate ligase